MEKYLFYVYLFWLQKVFWMKRSVKVTLTWDTNSHSCSWREIHLPVMCSPQAMLLVNCFHIMRRPILLLCMSVLQTAPIWQCAAGCILIAPTTITTLRYKILAEVVTSFLEGAASMWTQMQFCLWHPSHPGSQLSTRTDLTTHRWNLIDVESAAKPLTQRITFVVSLAWSLTIPESKALCTETTLGCLDFAEITCDSSVPFFFCLIVFSCWRTAYSWYLWGLILWCLTS